MKNANKKHKKTKKNRKKTFKKNKSKKNCFFTSLDITITVLIDDAQIYYLT